MLLAAGADVDLAPCEGFTALMAAACWRDTETARLLLERGADANGRSSSGGTTALTLAAVGNRVDLCRVLVSGGARTDLKLRNGQTALDVARALGHSSIVEYLERVAARAVPTRPNARRGKPR